jgi:hypothetical protein
MDKNQEAYYVTPPTLYLPPDGIRITLVGSDQEWIESITTGLENTFPTITVTFYHVEEQTKDQWEWVLAMADLADLLIVDIGSASQQELLISFLHQGNKCWYSVPEECDNIPLLSLLNTLNANMFQGAEQLNDLLRTFLGND